jgi:hypothetical protein
MSRSRTAFGIILFLLSVIGSAPLVLLIGVIGAFRYSQYIELLIAGFFFELLYGAGAWTGPVPFPMFFGSALLLVIIESVRTRIR